MFLKSDNYQSYYPFIMNFEKDQLGMQYHHSMEHSNIMFALLAATDPESVGTGKVKEHETGYATCL